MSKKARKRVFVVHGRNPFAKGAMFDFIRAVGLEPIEWNEAVATLGPSPQIEHVVRAAVLNSDAVVILLTGDDEVRLRSPFHLVDDPEEERNMRPQARPNVIFEAGLALGRAAKRTILVQLGDVKSFSDILGRHILRMDDSRTKRRELVTKLRAAGLNVDANRDKWLKAGKFSDAISFARTKDSLIQAYHEYLDKWERRLLKRGLSFRCSPKELARSTVRQCMYPPDACIIVLPHYDGKEVVSSIERLMDLRDDSHLPIAIVVDSFDTRRLVGILTPSDVAGKFGEYQVNGPVSVENICTTSPWRVHQDDIFSKAARYIDKTGVKSGLPVVDKNNRFVGFLPPHRGREFIEADIIFGRIARKSNR